MMSQKLLFVPYGRAHRRRRSREICALLEVVAGR